MKSKEVIKWLGWPLLFLFLWFRGCSPEPGTVTVTVPEQPGTFEPVKPVHDTIYVPEYIVRWKDKEVVIENPINTQLFEKYINAADSLQRLKYYLDAITIYGYHQEFSDDFVSIDVAGTVRGEIETMKIDYLIKERTVDIPKPKGTVFRLLGGVEFGNTTQFDDFLIKGNLGFQNKKGDVFTASFDTEQRIWLGYNFSIFQIKR